MTTELTTEQAISLATDCGAFYRRQTGLMAVFAVTWIALAVVMPTFGVRAFDAAVAGFMAFLGVGSIVMRSRSRKLVELAALDVRSRWFVRGRHLVGLDADSVPIALRIIVPRRVHKQLALPAMTAVAPPAAKSD